MNGNQSSEESEGETPPLRVPKPKIIRRYKWGGKRPRYQNLMFLPAKAVLLTYHTNTEPCMTFTECKNVLKNLQKRHKEKEDFADIAYNFLIGGDGLIYKGRGWLFNAERPKDEYREWSGKCLEIAFIGDYRNQELPSDMDQAAKALIAYGVSKSFIHENYQLIHKKKATIMLNSPSSKISRIKKTNYKKE